MKESTKEKLLSAAVEVFAQEGYRDATVTEICERAGANVAAINYHFGSKENIFRHSLRRAFEIADAKYPIRGRLTNDASAEEKLKVFMNATIERCFDPGEAGQFDRIMSHEGTRLSAPHKMILSELNEIQGKLLDSIFIELLGTESKVMIHQARINIVGICVLPNLAPNLRKRLFPKPPSPSTLRHYIDRQITFALAGIKAISKERESE